MCGIAGILRWGETKLPTEIVPQLWEALRLRGPDSYGYYSLQSGKQHASDVWDEAHSDSELLLVHRRLSILGIDQRGWQPMSTDCQRYTIVYNGEVYNYLELRDELRDQGYSFKSDSDTEVLLYGYAHWGRQVLDRVIGMFAFAIIDIEQQQVFIARDQFGIKPLFYNSDKNRFCFSSTIQSLLVFPGVAREVNPKSVYNYLRFGVTDCLDQTLLSSVKQLPPAHWISLNLTDGAMETGQYWDVDYTQERAVSFDQAKVEFRDLFLESVKLHMRSDVPLGVALSGGLDSTAIASAIRYLYQDSLDIRTYSYVADRADISEEHWIDQVANDLKTDSHKVSPSFSDLNTSLKHLIQEQGEPFGSASVFAQWSVVKLAKEDGIKVLLEGQGADEMLGGYTQYRAPRLVSMIRSGDLFSAANFLAGCRNYPEGVLWVLLKSFEYLLPSAFLSALNRRYFSSYFSDILDISWFENRAAFGYPKETRFKHPVLKQDLKSALNRLCIPHLLRKGDRNSMAFSIENRVPFLTPQLVSYCYSLPENYLISDRGETKYLLKESMKDILPQAVYRRKDKIGFQTSEKQWLTSIQSEVEEVFDNDSTGFPFLRGRSGIKRLFGSSKTRDFNYLWRLYNLLEWSKVYNVSYS